MNDASPLAEQNLSRVAASATEIQEVLKTQPGLMIELKAWMAEDATAKGQILTDGDLTDEAVFDRLGNDVKFRSVATRLLERYGYLIPEINPKSEQGQERDMLMKERTIQLARAEEQERTAPPPAPPKTEETKTCNPIQDRSCMPSLGGNGSGSSGQGPAYASPYGGGIYPQFGILPLSPYSTPLYEREIQASFPGTATSAAQTAAQMSMLGASAAGGLGSGSSFGQTAGASAAMGMASQSAMGSQLGMLPPGVGFGDSSVAYAGGAQPAVNQPWERQTTTSALYAGAGGGPPAMVSRPNPFANIPSLYDMYMQAAPQPGQLERFGEAVFHDTNASNQLIPMDLPAGPDYVVGPGDVLTVNMWGGVSGQMQRAVDRTGRVTLPEVGPLLVSGQTLGQVQQAVERSLRTQFRDVSADVSLSLLRTVRVYVVGDAERPGAYDVSSLSTPLNAEFAAGGPTSVGSLRLLEHWRGDKLLQTVDVYDLLLRGVTGDIVPLENGDTVRVPPIGSEVSVEGMVRRPAIYELNGEKTLANILQLAGGILPTAALGHIEVDRLVAHEKRTMLSLDVSNASDPAAVEKQLASFQIQDRDGVNVFPVAPYNQDAIYLEGHVVRPGKYAYRPGMKLTDLIASYKDVLPMPASYAEIIRLSSPDKHPSVTSFDLAKALANPSTAPKLQPLDTIQIFSRYDFTNPPTVYVGGEVRHPGLYSTSGQVHLRDAIALAGGASPDADMNYAQVFHPLQDGRMKVSSVNLGRALDNNPIDDILLGPRDLLLVHPSPAHVDPPIVYVKGEVLRPARYPLTVNMHVADLIRMGGGLKRSADPTVADLMRYTVSDNRSLTGQHMLVNIASALGGDPSDNLPLRDGDILTVRELPGWQDIGASVTLSGEVVHPGVYPIRPGERLSSALDRAGGFLPTAYPQGIVFEREEVKMLQRQSRQDLIQRLRQQEASFKASIQTSASEQAQLQQAAYAQSEHAIAALEQAPITGRMVVRLNPSLQRFRNSTDDIELRAGDTIAIPKRPDFVLVTGQVYNANAITFMPRRNASWYLRQAGGPTSDANKKGVFIIRANGAVVSGHANGWLLHGSVLSTEIQPGDTIVVPERVLGVSVVWRNLLSVAQLAQSASFVALATGL
ncbi:MAG TPA: SLBB domain-containing protein [Candidatus Acidoferrales bacterium]|nr:SLBB domain-containing protein [Candidatus Acidoferrales bacterium]